MHRFFARNILSDCHFQFQDFFLFLVNFNYEQPYISEHLINDFVWNFLSEWKMSKDPKHSLQPPFWILGLGFFFQLTYSGVSPLVQKLMMCCSNVDVRRAAWENVKWFFWVVGKRTTDFANMAWRLYFYSGVRSRLSSVASLSNLATNVTFCRRSTYFTSRFGRCNWARNHTSVCRVDIKYLITKNMRNILGL